MATPFVAGAFAMLRALGQSASMARDYDAQDFFLDQLLKTYLVFQYRKRKYIFLQKIKRLYNTSCILKLEFDAT